MRNLLLLLALCTMATGSWFAMRAGKRNGLTAKTLESPSQGESSGPQAAAALEATPVLPPPMTAEQPVRVAATREEGEVIASAEAQVSAEHPVRVFGVITVDGYEASARLVFKGDRAIGAEARGTYEVLLPEPGHYDLRIRLDDPDRSIATAVDVREDSEQRFDVNIRLGGIEGYVRSPSGPVAGITVIVRSPTGELTATTQADGHYAVESLPAETWSVETGGRPRGLRLELGPSYHTGARIEDVVVAPGQWVHVDDLHVTEAGVLSVRVFAPTGVPAETPKIRILGPSDNLIDECGGKTSQGEGIVSIGALEPGAYTLRAFEYLTDYAEGSAIVEAGKETALELRLARATIARILVHGIASGAWDWDALACHRSDGKDFSGFKWNGYAGERSVGPLPPGTYTFSLEIDGVMRDQSTVTLVGEPHALVELFL